MKVRILSALLAGAALAGCEQSSQTLPFAVDDVVQQTIPAAGGTVSTPSGASVEFPAGSVSASVAVSLTVVAKSPETSRSGSSVSETFKLEPAGLELKEPAMAELKFVDADRSRSWLASVVTVANGKLVEHGDTRVEIGSGVAATGISQLGTLAVVIPPADAVFRVRRETAPLHSLSAVRSSLLATGTDSVVVHCGDPSHRCTGLAASASASLMDRVEDAAAIYPAIDGSLRISGPSASDSLVLHTSVRALLQSGQTAENVTLNAVLKPTASTVVTEDAAEIRMTNVFFRITGDATDGSGTKGETNTLVITKGAASGTISLSRTFQLRNAGGALEAATVTLVVPVDIYQ
jgi:hypothetical protein